MVTGKVTEVPYIHTDTVLFETEALATETTGRTAARLNHSCTCPCFLYAHTHFLIQHTHEHTHTKGSEGDHSVNRQLIERKQERKRGREER